MTDPTVRAAGGVVWRPGPAGAEVLLIHRPKYDDWTLPKGKLEAGETEVEAAVREIEEETGMVAEPGADLGLVRYVDHLGNPKTVRYWAMRPVGGEAVPADGTDAVEYVLVAEALERLTYDRDRAVLRQFTTRGT